MRMNIRDHARCATEARSMCPWILPEIKSILVWQNRELDGPAHSCRPHFITDKMIWGRNESWLAFGYLTLLKPWLKWINWEVTKSFLSEFGLTRIAVWKRQAETCVYVSDLDSLIKVLKLLWNVWGSVGCMVGEVKLWRNEAGFPLWFVKIASCLHIL